MEVQQQRLLLRRDALGRPGLAVEKGVVLRHDAAARGRIVHLLRRLEPAGFLLRPQGERLAQPAFIRRSSLAQQGQRGGGVAEGLLRHAVGVDVVVYERVVFIRTGDTVDDKAPVLFPAETAQIPIQPRAFDEKLRAALREEVQILRRLIVLPHRVGDVAVDMVLRGPRGEVRAALLPVDRAPGEERALRVAHDARAGTRLRQHREAVLQQLSRQRRVGVDEHGQDIGLGIPEGVPLIALAGQALGGDVARTVPSGGLQQVEEIEAQALQQRVVAADLKKGVVPEFVEEGALLVREHRKTRRLAADPFCLGAQALVVLAAHGAVADAFFQTQLLARADGRFRDPAHAVALRRGPEGERTPVLNGAADGKAAVFRALPHRQQSALGLRPQREQAAVLAGGVAGVVGIPLGDDGGLDRALDAQRALSGYTADAQPCRREGLPRQTDQPLRLRLEHGAAPRVPGEAAPQQPRAQIQHAAVGGQLAHAEVQPFAVRAEHEALGVHHIADGLVVFGIAVDRLAIADRLGIEHCVEKAALDCVRPGGGALLQIAAQSDEAVAQREDRLVFRQVRRAKSLLCDRPGLKSKFRHRLSTPFLFFPYSITGGG